MVAALVVPAHEAVPPPSPSASATAAMAEPAVEFSSSGRRLPAAPADAGTHAAVSSEDMAELQNQLAKLSTWAVDVRKLPSGMERRRQPSAPTSPRRRLDPASPRPSARALKFATALSRANTARDRQRVQAAAVAMQKPVEHASKLILNRMEELESTLTPPEPEPEPEPELLSTVSSKSSDAPPQKWDVEPLDRNDLGEEDFSLLIESPGTGIFRNLAGVAGVVGVVQKMNKNHEATKPDRSEFTDAVHSLERSLPAALLVSRLLHCLPARSTCVSRLIPAGVRAWRSPQRYGSEGSQITSPRGAARATKASKKSCRL